MYLSITVRITAQPIQKKKKKKRKITAMTESKQVQCKLLKSGKVIKIWEKNNNNKELRYFVQVPVVNPV